MDELPITLEEAIVEAVLVRRILLDDLEVSPLVSSHNLSEVIVKLSHTALASLGWVSSLAEWIGYCSI